jgi:collagen beta-1,O-galactosyltransferase
MVISNSQGYGYILVPLDQEDSLLKDAQQVVNTKVAIVNHHHSVVILPELAKFVTTPEKTKLGFSEVHMINLKRRPERRIKMELTMKELGLDFKHFEAVDGKTLTDDVLVEKGITLLPEYSDPYHKRQMTMGEIGCFLSHYMIWQRMIELGQEEVLILEDDIRFEPFFMERADQLMKEARFIGGWDMIYFGRKRLQENENFIKESENFVHVSYTYWTLGYVITLEGAKKLLASEPLKRLLPVDEYLPIMFDQHPNDTWKLKFETRNLNAWSVNPLILFPTHYTGEDGYISDTEDSKLIKLDLLEESETLLGEEESILHHVTKHDSSEL